MRTGILSFAGKAHQLQAYMLYVLMKYGNDTTLADMKNYYI